MKNTRKDLYNETKIEVVITETTRFNENEKYVLLALLINQDETLSNKLNIAISNYRAKNGKRFITYISTNNKSIKSNLDIYFNIKRLSPEETKLKLLEAIKEINKLSDTQTIKTELKKLNIKNWNYKSIEEQELILEDLKLIKNILIENNKIISNRKSLLKGFEEIRQILENEELVA